MQGSKSSDRGQDTTVVDLTKTRLGHVLLTYVGGKDAVFKLFECVCLLSHTEATRPITLLMDMLCKV